MFVAALVVPATGGFHERKEDIRGFKTNTSEDNEMEHLGGGLVRRRETTNGRDLVFCHLD